MTFTKPHPAYQSLIALCAGYFLIMLLLGFDRHWGFKTSIYDTGVFDQAIWSCLNGECLLNTINFSKPINWLGFHFHPIILAFVPLYKLSPSPEWLIFAQSLSIALTALPIYKIALNLNYSNWQAFFWGISFLLNPFVLSAVIWDFHPVAIAAPFISLSIYYIITNKFERLLTCIFIILLCQEHFGILTIFIGISFWIYNRNIVKSLTIFIIGLLHTIILFIYVFPLLSPTGAHIMLSTEVKSLSRYNWLGGSFTSIISNIFTNPLQILKFTFVDLEAYKYILLLLVPYGLVLPILGIEILLIGSADFAANTLSLNPLQRSINGYHSISLIPVIIISAMIGLCRIKRIYSQRQYNRVMAITLASFATLFAICILHIFGKDSLWNLTPRIIRDPELEKVLSLIPEDASLSVQANIGSHFSQRYKIYAYPNKASEVDFIILRLEDMDESLKTNDIRFLHHMSLGPQDYLASLQCLLDSKAYNIYYFSAPWLVLAKHPKGNSEINSENLKLFLETLKKQWHIPNTSPFLNKCSGIK
jgi:uncharacterized membrane protein